VIKTYLVKQTAARPAIKTKISWSAAALGCDGRIITGGKNLQSSSTAWQPAAKNNPFMDAD